MLEPCTLRARSVDHSGAGACWAADAGRLEGPAMQAGQPIACQGGGGEQKSVELQGARAPRSKEKWLTREDSAKTPRVRGPRASPAS